MSKFNSRSVGQAKTTNKAGGSAYQLPSEKIKLVTQVLTSFFNEKKYYGDNSKEIVQTIRNVLKVDAKFIASLALYAREVFYLRSISHVLTAELAHSVEGKQYARRVIARVAQRPDDMTEILSYYMHNFGKPIPNSMKKGLADAFKKFDEYQLAKYNRKQDVTLKDIVMISHPRPNTAEQATLIKKLLDDKLEVPVTWETQLSAKGNTKEVWEELIASKKVGYMATLRNLRNIINSGATNVEQVYSYIENANAVAKSKQLPFRFFSAYREIQKIGRAGSRPLDTIEKALELSVQNLPKLEGTTFIVSDMSGSMGSGLSERGSVTYANVASLLMSIAHQFCDNAITSVFAESFEVVNVSKSRGILDNMQTFESKRVGYSTNLYKSIKWLIENKIKVDRIVVLSDMQAYSYDSRNTQSYLDEYRRKINPDVWMHSVDLAGYGTSQFANNGKVNLLGGWSDKVLEFIKLAEQGTDTLVGRIENYAEL